MVHGVELGESRSGQPQFHEPTSVESASRARCRTRRTVRSSETAQHDEDDIGLIVTERRIDLDPRRAPSDGIETSKSGGAYAEARSARRRYAQPSTS